MRGELRRAAEQAGLKQKIAREDASCALESLPAALRDGLVLATGGWGSDQAWCSEFYALHEGEYLVYKYPGGRAMESASSAPSSLDEVRGMRLTRAGRRITGTPASSNDFRLLQ